jgi:hypothetical protein
MANRRFEGYTNQDLRDVERNFEKWGRKWKKEEERWWREGLVSDSSWHKNEEYQNILKNIELNEKDKRELREEWGLRMPTATQYHGHATNL